MSFSLEHGNATIGSWAHPKIQIGSDDVINIDVSSSHASSIDFVGKVSLESRNKIPFGVLFGYTASEPFERLPFKEFEDGLEFRLGHAVEFCGSEPVGARVDPVLLGDFVVIENKHSIVDILKTVP